MASAWGAIGTLINVASILFGGGTPRRQVILTCEGERMILPVTPREYSVSTGQGNKVIEVEQLGEALVFGLPSAVKISFECFFPNQEHNYPFVVGDDKDPTTLVQTIIKWKESRKPVRVIITDSPVNMMAGIMSFNYKEQDGSRDIYYSISFTEYKDLNTPQANNNKQINDDTGLKNRPSPSIRADGASKISNGSDIVDAARKVYGTANKWRRIAKSNDLKNLAINNVSKLRGLKMK